MLRTTGRIDIAAVALDPIHHGAGSSGNTQLLRTQDVLLEDGRLARVPFVSGNSLKHRIREAGARYALEAMGVADGTLAKPVVDLLFSGGALTKSGAAVDLSRARALGELFPLLSLCGYSAGNAMVPGKLRVDNLHLVCAENSWRLPEAMRALPVATRPAGAMRGEEFGTRHEPSRVPHVARLLSGSETKRLEGQAAMALEAPHSEKGDSLQMIYDWQVIKPGSRFWGAIHVEGATDMELAALRSALSTACDGDASDGGVIFRVGAKSSIGHGRMSWRLSGSIREPVKGPGFAASDALTVGGKDASDEYAAHLRARSAEILAGLAGAFA